MEPKVNKKYWFAIYTKPRAEKKTYSKLTNKGIETYLPLQKTLKQWSDRKKWVEEPLFRSYIFVKVVEKEYLEVLKTNGVVYFVSFERKKVPVPDSQIQAIKRLLSNEIEFEVTTEKYDINDSVEIIYGSLKGIQGTLIEYRGKRKVLIKVDSISQGLLIDIPLVSLRKIN
ncbi:MAG: UpxY family transcription antiterminator [Bacteroidales bacterium]|nr:UpxY family transcription antiterminator [Bacteroidales bacterium]